MTIFKNYYEPTPAKYRKFGDALLASSTAATFIGIQLDEKWMIYVFLLLGVVGKFLTNFFTLEDQPIIEETIIEKKSRRVKTKRKK